MFDQHGELKQVCFEHSRMLKLFKNTGLGLVSPFSHCPFRALCRVTLYLCSIVLQHILGIPKRSKNTGLILVPSSVNVTLFYNILHCC